MHVLDQEQTQLFLAAARRYYGEKTLRGTPKRQNLYPLFLAAVLTGARQGELLGLTWKALDLMLGAMAIQQTFYRVGKEQVFKQPKTDNSSRSINLPPILVEELRQVRRDQDERRRHFGPQYEDHDLVFCQENGKPLHGRNLTRRDLKQILKRAKLPGIRFHDLRHGRATLGLKNGEHPKIVSEILGHSSVAFTMQTYSHVLPGMQAEAARKLEESLLGSAHNRRTNATAEAGTAGKMGLAVH
jgi:integrase